MSVKLIGKIINSECYQLIQRTDGGAGRQYYIKKQTKPLFKGDSGTSTIFGLYDDEDTARSEFKLICEAAKDFGRG